MGEINSDRDRAAKIQKLLFLGSGGSGKSTFFKQLRCIHGHGFSAKDRRVFKEHISAQIIEQINRSVECIAYYNEKLLPDYEELQLSKEGLMAAQFMEQTDPECMINSEITTNVKILWKEDAIQQIYAQRAIYHIDDSSAYFFESIDRINEENYLPTDMDILYVRYRTTGVIESKFSILGSQFHIFDVGGQQSERKKWIHCFEKVTAVIFVASLSCYDELMFEDDTINCMIDSLELFKEICNLQWFVDTPIILFLNKKDLFEKKIHIIPLSVCFKEYDVVPPTHHDSADHSNSSSENDTSHLLQEQKNQYMIDSRNYIKQRFTDFNNNQKNRQIYVHITVATDRTNVQTVFNDVQQIVVSAGLTRNNLI